MSQANIPCAVGSIFCTISKTMRWHIATPSRRLPAKNLPLAAFTQLWVSHFRRHPFSLFKRETERKDGENKWQSIIWKQK